MSDLRPAGMPYHRARHTAQEKGCTCQWWGDKHIAEYDRECLIPEHRGEARLPWVNLALTCSGCRSVTYRPPRGDRTCDWCGGELL